MFELLTLGIFGWLLVKAVGVALKLTWGAAKIVASVLIGLVLPVLFICLLFVGGIVLLVPVVMIAIAAAILKGFA